MTLLDDAREMKDDLVSLRRQIHRDPEIGLALPLTQERVLSALDGLEVTTTSGTDFFASKFLGTNNRQAVAVRFFSSAVTMLIQ